MKNKYVANYIKREKSKRKALEYANLDKKQRKIVKKDRKALKTIEKTLDKNNALKAENTRLREENEKLRREVRALRAAAVSDDIETEDCDCSQGMGCRQNPPRTYNEQLEHSYEFLKEENKLC